MNYKHIQYHVSTYLTGRYIDEWSTDNVQMAVEEGGGVGGLGADCIRTERFFP